MRRLAGNWRWSADDLTRKPCKTELDIHTVISRGFSAAGRVDTGVVNQTEQRPEQQTTEAERKGS